MQYQLLGGATYTPIDRELSALRSNWDVLGRGIPDYSRLNTERFNTFHRVNLRADYKLFFTSWNLNLYLDIQNLLAQTVDGEPIADVLRDPNTGMPLVDPNDPLSYQISELPNSTGSLIPTLGLIAEF